MWRLALALILAAPGPVFAQVVAPIRVRLVAPPSPVAVSLGAAGASTPQLTTPTPGLPATSASVPSLAPTATPFRAPVAALTAQPVAKTALEGLKTELETPKPDGSDPSGSRAYAGLSFEVKLGIPAPKSAGFLASVESTFHPLAKADASARPDAADGDVKPAPPNRKYTDGGGANYGHRLITFLGETFRSLLFRPNVPVEKEIIRALDATRKGDTVSIAIYEFKQSKVLDALRKARAREVDVRILLDYGNVFPPAKKSGDDYTPTRSKEIWALAREGFDIKVVRGLGLYGIMHNKIAVIERGQAEAMVIFGSYNWSWTAENDHYENANFTLNKKRVDFLKATWNWLDSLSQPVVYNRTNGTIWLKNPDHQWPKTVPAPPQYPGLDVEFSGIMLPAVVASPAPLGSPSIETRIVEAIDASHETIEMSIFTLRSTLIAEALARAAARRVQVRVIIDKSQASNDIIRIYAEYLAFNKIPVRLLSGPDPTAEFQLAQKDHHKFSRFDGKLIETGSPNYTKNAAVNNFENGHFINDLEEKENIAGYGKIFEHMWRRAEPFAAPAAAPILPTDAELVRELGETPQNNELRLVSAIDASHRTISISVLALRSTLIAEALARATARRVQVRVIIDEGQYNKEFIQTYADWLAYHKIAVHTIAEYEMAPGSQNIERFAIFDDNLTETQLASYTKFGLMAGHGLFVPGREAAQRANDIFEHLWQRSQPVAAPAAAPAIATNAELIADITGTAEASEETPGPLPTWPRPKARQISYNGNTYPAVVMRPDFPIEPLVVKMLRAARKNVSLALYEFDLESVMEALRWLKANKPEVKINIIIDRSHVYTAGKDSTGGPRKPSRQIVALITEGFNPLILKGKKGGIMHSKYLIVDAPETAPSEHPSREKDTGIVFRGSYNLTRTGEHNHYENVVISTEKERVLNYLGDFQYKQDLAEPVDRDKLDEILARTTVPSRAHGDADFEGFDEPHFSALSAEETSAEEYVEKNPPPSNPETPFDLNREKFQREYFSPGGGILDAWIRAINAAEKTIEIAMFGFYSRALADAVVKAFVEKRWINPDFRLRLALDAGQSSLAKFDKTNENPNGIPVNLWFKKRGVDVVISNGPHPGRDNMFEKLHSKYMIVDGKFVITGSWNASETAENFSFENATILMDPLDVAMFVWDFERIRLRGWVPGERKPKPSPVTDAITNLAAALASH